MVKDKVNLNDWGTVLWSFQAICCIMWSYHLYSPSPIKFLVSVCVQITHLFQTSTEFTFCIIRTSSSHTSHQNKFSPAIALSKFHSLLVYIPPNPPSPSTHQKSISSYSWLPGPWSVSEIPGVPKGAACRLVNRDSLVWELKFVLMCFYEGGLHWYFDVA